MPIKNSKIEDEKAVGYVFYINQYGNIIVNITQSDFDTLGVKIGDSVDIKIGDKTQKGKVGTTYGDVFEPEGDEYAYCLQWSSLNCNKLVNCQRIFPNWTELYRRTWKNRMMSKT